MLIRDFACLNVLSVTISVEGSGNRYCHVLFAYWICALS